MFRVFIVLALFGVAQSSLADEKYEFNSEQQRLNFVQLSQELRCPMCQNQNIADSNALIATDMKRKVYELLKEGKTNDQVIHFMKVRYGDFVHYKPPMTPVTLWLYLGPVLFITLALSYFFLSNRNRKLQQANSSNEQILEQSALNDAKLKQAEKALRELE